MYQNEGIFIFLNVSFSVNSLLSKLLKYSACPHKLPFVSEFEALTSKLAKRFFFLNVVDTLKLKYV